MTQAAKSQLAFRVSLSSIVYRLSTKQGNANGDPFSGEQHRGLADR